MYKIEQRRLHTITHSVNFLRSSLRWLRLMLIGLLQEGDGKVVVFTEAAVHDSGSSSQPSMVAMANGQFDRGGKVMVIVFNCIKDNG